MKKQIFFVLLLVAGLLLSACGASAPDSTEVRPFPHPDDADGAVNQEQSDSAAPRAVPQIEVEGELTSETAAEPARPFATAPAADLTWNGRPIAPPPGGPPPGNMQFRDEGVNPFVSAWQDNLSTFAIDVDTGAYTIMRRYLTDGLLPPADAVRVEEYVNYFEQDYPLPDDEAFAIHVDGAPSPFASGEPTWLVRVGVQGYDVRPEERPDALLIFVIDVSGSMSRQNRLENVKESLRMLIQNLRPTDRIGIVVYGSNARLLLEPTYAVADRAILSAIDRLQPEGSTNAEAGLRLAYQLADQYAVPGQISRLLLCSDGVANVGQTTAEAILEHARNGVALSTFGFGADNYNDTLMEQLADQGDGVYAYIDSADEAHRLFTRQLNGTLLTIARDAKIQVEFNPGIVQSYRLLGYENRDVADRDFRNDAVDAGEVGAGHSVTALYEIQIARAAAPTEALMNVYVRYADPVTGEVDEVSRSAAVRDFARSFDEASPRLQLAATVAQYAEILRRSIWTADWNMNHVADEARRVARMLPADPDVQEFAALAALAARMMD